MVIDKTPTSDKLPFSINLKNDVAVFINNLSFYAN